MALSRSARRKSGPLNLSDVEKYREVPWKTISIKILMCARQDMSAFAIVAQLS